MSRIMTKPTEWVCAQWRLRSAWASLQSDQSSLCAQWVAKDPSFLHADNEDSYQTGQMPRLVWVFAGHMLILLVLSWCGSYYSRWLYYCCCCFLQPSICRNPVCNNRSKFMLDVNKSRFVDFQKVRIQETQAELPRGSIPRRYIYKPPHDKTNKMACSPSEDPDQPGHPTSQIKVFAVRLKKAWVLSYPLSAQWRLIRLGGCPGWSESSLGIQSFCWFCHAAAQICSSAYHENLNNSHTEKIIVILKFKQHGLSDEKSWHQRWSVGDTTNS